MKFTQSKFTQSEFELANNFGKAQNGQIAEEMRQSKLLNICAWSCIWWQSEDSNDNTQFEFDVYKQLEFIPSLKVDIHSPMMMP